MSLPWFMGEAADIKVSPPVSAQTELRPTNQS